MARERGTFNFSASLEIKKEGALDARQVVNTKAELILADTWLDEDNKVWLYSGLLVCVVNDTDINNGVYFLKNKDTYTEDTSWIKIASISGSTPDELEQSIKDALAEAKQYTDDEIAEVNTSVTNLTNKHNSDVTTINNTIDALEDKHDQNIADINTALDEIRDNITNVEGDYLKRSGGTMTGDIILDSSVQLNSVNSAGENVNLISVGGGTTTQEVYVASNNLTTVIHSNDSNLLHERTTGNRYIIFDEANTDPRNLIFNGTTYPVLTTVLGPDTVTWYAPITAGTNGQILTSTGGVPKWSNQSSLSITMSQISDLGSTWDTYLKAGIYERNLVINGTTYPVLTDVSGAKTITGYIPTTAGTSGQILSSTGGTPSWINQSALKITSSQITNLADYLTDNSYHKDWYNSPVFMNGITSYISEAGTTGGWARALTFKNQPNSAQAGAFGVLGSGDNISYSYVSAGDNEYNSTEILKVYSTNITFGDEPLAVWGDQSTYDAYKLYRRLYNINGTGYSVVGTTSGNLPTIYAPTTMSTNSNQVLIGSSDSIPKWGYPNVISVQDVRDLDNPDPTPDQVTGRVARFYFTNQSLPSATGMGQWISKLTVSGWNQGYNVWELAGGSTNTFCENLAFRAGINDTWGDWHTIAFQDWTTTQLARYLPLTGGTLTGNLTMGTNTKINLNRVSSGNGISFYSPSFYTWYDYMETGNEGNACTGGDASTYGNVTSWARRSTIENQSGYGWIWDSCANTSGANPIPRMALSSKNGDLYVAGDINIGIDGEDLYRSLLIHRDDTTVEFTNDSISAVVNVSNGSNVGKLQIGLSSLLYNDNTVAHTGNLFNRNIGVNGTNWAFTSRTNSSSSTSIYAPTTAGTSGQYLKSTGGAPTWTNDLNGQIGGPTNYFNSPVAWLSGGAGAAYIVLTLPGKKTDNQMFSFDLRIYGAYESTIINFTGYLYNSQATVYNFGARSIINTRTNLKCYSGYNSNGNGVIVIQSNDGAFSYYGIAVENCMLSYRASSAWGVKSNWALSVQSSAPTLTSGSVSSTITLVRTTDYALTTDIPDTIAWSNISGKPSWIGSSKPSYSWNEITSKPSTFTPSAHTHPISEVTGRGTLTFTGAASGTYNGSGNLTINIPQGGGEADSVAWANVTGKPSWIGSTKPTYSYSEITGTIPIADIPTGTTSSTVALGNHTHNQYLTSIPAEYITQTELNSVLADYATTDDIPSLSGYATQSWVQSQGYITTAYTLPTASASTLGGIKVGAGLSISSAGVLSATGGGVADAVDWDNITSKPSWVNSTSKPTYTWSEISGKPSSFTPSAHTHSASEITSGTLALARIPTGTSSSTVALGNHTHSQYLTSISDASGSGTGYLLTDASGSTVYRRAMTSSDVTGALGFTPATSSHGHTFDDITFNNTGSNTQYLAGNGSFYTIRYSEISGTPDLSNYVTTDTKNTAGSTNSTSKLFIIGATSQAANPVTYSESGCYISGGELYSNGAVVATESYVTSRGYITSSALSGYATESYVDDAVANVSIDTSGFVTISGTQTITGAKTFTNSVGVRSSYGFYDISDIRLKSNIQDIELKGKINLYEFNKLDKHSYGVIAQEVEQIYPDVVQTDENGYKTVNYNEVLSIKCAELEAENRELKSRLDKLEAILAAKGLLD